MRHAGAAGGVVPLLEIGEARDFADPSLAGRRVLQTWHDGDGRLVASAGRDDGRWWMHWPRLGTYWFAAEGPVTVVPATDRLDDQLQDAFTRGVVPVVLLARGYEAFHASAVADDRGVALLCAPSGTGKSTVALGLAQDGLVHWADDAAIYHLRGDEPLVLALPFRPRVNDASRRSLTPAEPAATTSGERPLRCVYLLARDSTLDPDRPHLAEVPAPARFERLLAHAHPVDFDGDDRRRRFIEHLLAIAARVGVHECRFAPSLPALPRLCGALRRHFESL